MRSMLAKIAGRCAALALLVFTTAAPAAATGAATVPEIDASSISAGLGLLTAAALLLRARMRR